MPLISVIVPVYKVEPYLERCVESILAQTFSDYELILVDDGSPDRCPQMCDAYAGKDSRIHVIHQENGGLSAARNAGLDWIFENSDSSWVTFIDSDDWVHPLYLEILLDAVTLCHQDISVCPPKFAEEYHLENYEKHHIPVHTQSSESFYQEVDKAPNTAWAKLYKKELWQEIRYPVGKLHEDRFTTYKLLFLYERIAVVEVPLYYYFRNANGIVMSQWSPKRLDDLEAMEEQLKYFKTNSFEDAFVHTLKEYVHSLVYSLRNMKNKREFSRKAAEVRNKLRITLLQYHKLLDVSFRKDFNTYKYAYPIAAKVYRRIMNIKQ